MKESRKISPWQVIFLKKSNYYFLRWTDFLACSLPAFLGTAANEHFKWSVSFQS